MTRFEQTEIPGSEMGANFIRRANASRLVKIISGIIHPLIGETLKLVPADRAQALDADHLVTGLGQAFEEDIAVLVWKIVFSRLRHLPRKVHAALVIDVQQLENGNERGLADIVRADQMKGID